MTLGEKIKLHRQNLGLSQEALAEKLNVSRQAVTKWESNNGVPDIDNLIALSRVIGISLDELVLGEEARDVQDLEKGLASQRKKKSMLYLTAAVCFGFAMICWIVSTVLNVDNGNSAAAVLSCINVLLNALVSGTFLRKYIDAK